MQKFIEIIKKNNELKIINEPLDINLEIPHAAYLEVKKPNGGKALLFTNPHDNGRKFSTPVLMNIYSSFDRCKLIFGRDIEGIASEIEELMHMKPPQNLMDKFGMLGKLFGLKSVFPKRVKSGISQEIIKKGDAVDLRELPILTTWEEDGGPFITMGQVYTKSLDGVLSNLGMYRIQIYDKNHIGLHWQIHKDSSHFFDQYKKANKPMPVSIAIGGDPLYTWCGQAPLPHGIFELLLYGFIKKEPAKIVKCITNDIFVPHDADFVIEALIENPNELKIEGPFGDHTGYYTLKEPFPFAKVTAITHKKEPVFLATVVGKPPIEDKYMGWATERIFLPLLKTTAPDLIDYHMPENGVFHNLILAKIKPHYPAHALQIMHAFWGVGQMSFVKHAIFVDQNAPKLTDYEAFSDYVLNRICHENILISSGVVDHLDHSSPKQFVGGKLGIDATGSEIEKPKITLLSDDELFKKAKELESSIIELRQIKTNTKNPITLIKYKKTKPSNAIFQNLKPLEENTKIVVLVDDLFQNDLENSYMIIWRTVNNIDARRDIYFNCFIGIDASTKNAIDNFDREWPKDVVCTKEVIKKLKEKNVIQVSDEEIKKWQIIQQ
ncbi:MAG: 4-hydroxy-3-polyprenylbenzoate decarboxylase [Campylobacterota bacterium]|nr:4-hydroxy-3-polyprenylbenzoate decarboxylase [Campylobacterota bacterium]